MKKIALLFSVIFIAFNLSATNHTVFTQGMSFNPNSLPINIGDTVTFTNNTGVSHNVNGTISTFPSNPESFGNSVSASWTFEHVFTIAGTYNLDDGIADPNSIVMGYIDSARRHGAICITNCLAKNIILNKKKVQKVETTLIQLT